eukprot:scaffold247979_cov23-Prasinocladus_malaysianus.AAC.1
MSEMNTVRYKCMMMAAIKYYLIWNSPAARDHAALISAQPSFPESKWPRIRPACTTQQYVMSCCIRHILYEYEYIVYLCLFCSY